MSLTVCLCVCIEKERRNREKRNQRETDKMKRETVRGVYLLACRQQFSFRAGAV